MQASRQKDSLLYFYDWHVSVFPCWLRVQGGFWKARSIFCVLTIADFLFFLFNSYLFYSRLDHQKFNVKACCDSYFVIKSWFESSDFVLKVVSDTSDASDTWGTLDILIVWKLLFFVHGCTAKHHNAHLNSSCFIWFDLNSRYLDVRECDFWWCWWRPTRRTLVKHFFAGSFESCFFRSKEVLIILKMKNTMAFLLFMIHMNFIRTQ